MKEDYCSPVVYLTFVTRPKMFVGVFVEAAIADVAAAPTDTVVLLPPLLVDTPQLTVEVTEESKTELLLFAAGLYLGDFEYRGDLLSRTRKPRAKKNEEGSFYLIIYYFHLLE